MPSGVATTITSCERSSDCQSDAMRARAGRSGRVRDLDCVSLRIEEFDEPAAHLAGAADHERAPAGALPLGRDLGLLLRRERTADQEAQQLVGERRRQPEFFRGRARVQQHFFLALEIAGRQAGRALCARDLLGEALPLGDEGEQFGVERCQPFAERFSSIRSLPSRVPALCTGPPASRASGPVIGASAFVRKPKYQPPYGSWTSSAGGNPAVVRGASRQPAS